LLSDFQMSIPELGTVKATSVPAVVVTSNGTRELSDALRRRCLYQYVEYPSYDKELAIIEAKMPEVGASLARQTVQFVQSVRRMELRKKPGIAETLDWAAALLRLGITELDRESPERIVESLAALIKTREDRAGLTREVVARIAQACCPALSSPLPGPRFARGSPDSSGSCAPTGSAWAAAMRSPRSKPPSASACTIATCCAGACRRSSVRAATSGSASAGC